MLIDVEQWSESREGQIVEAKGGDMHRRYVQRLEVYMFLIRALTGLEVC
jgi:hypothetical protein